MQALPLGMGVNLTSRQRGSCGSAERLCKSTFQYNANKFPLTYISETDNNSRENIVELRASRAILSGCPGCGYVHSSSKSPGKVTHIIVDDFCQAFPVSIIQLLLFLLVYEH